MATVTVGCKLPHGLVFLHMGKRYRFKGVKHTLAAKMGITAEADFGITENIPSEIFDEFMKQCKDSEFVKKGLIFAHEKLANVQAFVKAQKDVLSGFEGKTEADMKRSSAQLATLEKE